MKIVLIDDDILITNQFASIIENDRHSLSIVNDPLKAIFSIVSTKPDLIFVDFLMPSLSGIDLVKRVRSIPGFSAIDMYFMVHEEDIHFYESADTKGIQGYITKPLIVQEIHTILSNKSTNQVVTPSADLEQLDGNLDSQMNDGLVNDQEHHIVTNFNEITTDPIFDSTKVVHSIVSEEVLPKFETLMSLLRLLHQNISNLPKSLIVESIERTITSGSFIRESLLDLQILSSEENYEDTTTISIEQIHSTISNLLGSLVKFPDKVVETEFHYGITSLSIVKIFTALKKYFKDLSVDYTIDSTMVADSNEVRYTFSFLPKNDIIVTVDSETNLQQQLQHLVQIAPQYFQLNSISTTVHFFVSK